MSWLGASPGAVGIRKDVDVFVGLGFKCLDAIWANTIGNRNVLTKLASESGSYATTCVQDAGAGPRTISGPADLSRRRTASLAVSPWHMHLAQSRFKLYDASQALQKNAQRKQAVDPEYASTNRGYCRIKLRRREGDRTIEPPADDPMIYARFTNGYMRKQPDWWQKFPRSLCWACFVKHTIGTVCGPCQGLR